MRKKLPILYTFIRCPWAMRARLALCYMSIDFESREVDLKHKPQSLLDYSSKGTVPVLILPNGEIIDQSLDIILYAMPQASNKILIDELVQLNDDEFKVNLNCYKYPERAIDGHSQEYYRAECEKFLIILEEKLLGNRYLLGAEPSIADIAIFPLVRQFSKVDLDWFVYAPYPKVIHWLELISSSSYYEKAMQKFPLWADVCDLGSLEDL